MHVCYNYVEKDVRDSKKQKKWMLQHAAAYAQHNGHFAAQAINLDSMHVM